jgi:hypothetical protein
MKKLILITALFWASFWAWLFNHSSDRNRPGPDMPQAHYHVRQILTPDVDRLLAQYDVSRDDGTITSEEILNGHPPVEWSNDIYKVK